MINWPTIAVIFDGSFGVSKADGKRTSALDRIDLASGVFDRRRRTEPSAICLSRRMDEE
jgi:hypothetical protein